MGTLQSVAHHRKKLNATKTLIKSIKDTVEVTVRQQRRVTEHLSLYTDPIGVPHAIRTVYTSRNKKLRFIRMVMKWRNTLQV